MNGNKGGTHSLTETNNSLKTGIFVITALIHCTLCRNGSHTFVSCQTVICVWRELSYEYISLVSVVVVSDLSYPTSFFFHLVINVFAILV